MFADSKEELKDLKLIGRETVDGADCYKIRKMEKDSAEMIIYLDKESFLIPKVNYKAKNGPATDIIFKDYKSVEGIMIAFKMQIKSPQGMIDFVYDKVEFGVKIDDSVFAKPAPAPAPTPPGK